MRSAANVQKEEIESVGAGRFKDELNLLLGASRDIRNARTRDRLPERCS